MPDLRISPDLVLPIEFATEGVLVTGMRGSGKTNTAVRFVEVEYEAGIPFALVDPKGDTHGIRSSADGTAPGLSVPVFGGLHGDFPLEAATGARIADLLVDEMLSAVLDVSMLSKTGELPRFLTAFCNQLMHRHQLEPHVRTVVLAEAHRYIPQNVPAKIAPLKEAAASLLLEGRAFGLGCWAETQRPARLHKDVVEEVGTAILHRIGVAATNDKKTLAGWVSHHELAGEIVDSLTSLRAGEAWVLAPDLDILKRVRMDRRTTFDSAATPKAGAAPRRPSTMADIDAGAIKAALEDVIEKAKADDPAELKKQVASLKRELAEERRAKPEPEVQVERVEVPVVTPEVATLFGEACDDLGQMGTMLRDVVNGLTSGIEALGTTADSLRADIREATRDRQDLPGARPAGVGARPVADRPGTGRAAQRPDPPTRREPRRAAVPRAETAEGLTKPQQRVLDAVAWLNAVGFPTPSKQQVGFIAEYRVGKKVGGTFGNVLGELRSSGLIDYPAPGCVVLTDAGEATAAVADIDPTTEGLQAAVFARLDGPERRVLEVLVDAYPDDLAKQTVGELAGYTVGPKVGGTFGNILGRLRSLGLIEYPSAGRAVATPLLFLEGEPG